MKNYNIVFSIPIHEKFEVVVDQILNFFHFNPGCAIVFHISQGFSYNKSFITKNDFVDIINEIGDVFINPESVRTGYCDIIQAHLSNFNYIKSVVDFDFFSMCASNEMFIKPGLYDSVKDYDCGLEFMDINQNKYFNWYTGIQALKDEDLLRYIGIEGLDRFYGSHIEGSYYKKDLFGKIVDIIESFYDYKKMSYVYPREEIYFSTVTKALELKGEVMRIKENGLFSWSRWNSFMALKVWCWDVYKQQNNPLTFSVKRVDRSKDANLRIFLRKKTGLYNDVVKYINSLKTKDYLSIFCSDSFDFFKESVLMLGRRVQYIIEKAQGLYKH